MPPDRPAWLGRVLAAVLLLGLGALAVVRLTLPRDVLVVAPVIHGAVWQVGDSANPAIAYIAKEGRAAWRFEPGEFGEPFKRPYTRYVLVRRAIPSGEVTGTVHLADLEGAGNANAPAIIGATGDLLWTWRDSLEGYRMPALTRAVTAGQLALPPGTGRDVLPREAKGFTVSPSTPPVLVLRGTDARFYRVDQGAAALAPVDPATFPVDPGSSRVEDRFEVLVPPGQGRLITHPNRAMQKTFLTTTGRWYGLLSDGERATLGANISGEDAPSGNVARTLYTGPWRADDRGRPVLDTARVTAVGTSRLVQAGFIVRWAHRVWDVAEPSSSLVFTRARLGDDEPWEVARLMRDGAVTWRTSTGLASPGMILDLGDYLLVSGLPPGTRQDTDEQVTWIHTRTGQRTMLHPASGSVRPVPVP